MSKEICHKLINNKEDMKNVNIGLDIGIASVGWSILDAETFEIINHGVRLFNSVEDPNDAKLKNVVRREKRSLRRQLRRKKNVKLDFIKFLINQKIIAISEEGNIFNNFINLFFENKSYDVLNLRFKGLKEPLTKEELIAILYWYLANQNIIPKVMDAGVLIIFDH